MLAHERQQKILQLLRESGSIRISEITQLFDVSNETARRDLDYLQRRGYVHRVHGGANYLGNEKEDLPDEDAASLSVRERLAKAAAMHVVENDILFLGHGETIFQLAKEIRGQKNLTVLTNSLRVINELIDSPVTLYSLGGLIDRDERNMSGSIPISVIQRFYATKAFISCGGVSNEGNVSDYNDDGTLLSLMLQLSDRKFLVADGSKFGRHAFCHVCKLTDFDAVISDCTLPEAFRSMLEANGTPLYLAETE